MNGTGNNINNILTPFMEVCACHARSFMIKAGECQKHKAIRLSLSHQHSTRVATNMRAISHVLAFHLEEGVCFHFMGASVSEPLLGIPATQSSHTHGRWV